MCGSLEAPSFTITSRLTTLSRRGEAKRKEINPLIDKIANPERFGKLLTYDSRVVLDESSQVTYHRKAVLFLTRQPMERHFSVKILESADLPRREKRDLW